MSSRSVLPAELVVPPSPDTFVQIGLSAAQAFRPEDGEGGGGRGEAREKTFQTTQSEDPQFVCLWGKAQQI